LAPVEDDSAAASLFLDIVLDFFARLSSGVSLFLLSAEMPGIMVRPNQISTLGDMCYILDLEGVLSCSCSLEFNCLSLFFPSDKLFSFWIKHLARHLLYIFIKEENEKKESDIHIVISDVLSDIIGYVSLIIKITSGTTNISTVGIW
jgi:hypothetical protein